MKDKIRINLDVTPHFKTMMKSTQKRTGNATMVEVIRRAMALYDMATDLPDGSRLVIHHKDGQQETVRFF